MAGSEFAFEDEYLRNKSATDVDAALSFSFLSPEVPMPAGWSADVVVKQEMEVDVECSRTVIAPGLYSNAHVPTRGVAKNQTPQPPIITAAAVVQVAPHTARRGVKREAVTTATAVPATAVHAAVLSPTLTVVSSSSISPVHSSPSSSPSLQPVSASSRSCSSSAGSNSGGSGMGSEASDSNSDSDGFDDDFKRGSKKNHSAAKRKRSSGSDSNAEHEGEDGVAVDMVGVPLVGDKRQQRLQRNRASAQLSRERKKQYMKLLEKQLKEMADLNEGLTVQITALTTENTALKCRLSKLSIRERVAGRYPTLARSSASSISAGSMPAMESPITSHAGSSCSDASSAFTGSTPVTPIIADADESYVQEAKRLKVAAYSSPQSSPANGRGGTVNNGGAAGFNARTGMLLFTLVMSVGLFYNLVGLDMPAFGSHDSLARSLGRPTAGTGATLEPMEEVRQLVSMQPRAGQRVLASLPEPVSSSDATDDEHAFALVPLSTATGPAAASSASVSSASSITDAPDSRALDVYKQHAGVHRSSSGSLSTRGVSPLPSVLLQKLILQGNLTHDSDAHYLFCPQAMRITQTVWNGLMSNNQSDDGVTPSDRLERRSRATAADVQMHLDAAVEEEEEEEVVDADGDEKQLALFDRNGRARGVKRMRGVTGGVLSNKKTTASRLRNRLPAPTITAALPAPNAHEEEYAVPYATDLLPSLRVGDKLLLWLPLHTINPSAAGLGNQDQWQR